MANFNNHSTHYVPSADPAQNQLDNVAFFSNRQNVNGFDAVNHNGGSESFGHGWGFSGDQLDTAHDTSNIAWEDDTPQLSSHNTRGYGQLNDIFSGPVADHSVYLQGTGFGNGNNGFQNQQPQGNNEHGISPASLGNPHRTNALPNNESAPTQPKTIAPEALQSRAPSNASSSIPNNQRGPTQGSDQRPSRSLSSILPKGTPTGNHLVTSLDSLKQVTSLRSIHRYVVAGTEAVNLPISGSNIPAYVPRKSRNQIKQMLGSNQGFTATVSKKLSNESGSAKPVSVPTYVNASGRLSTHKNKPDQQSSSDESSDESVYESSDDEPQKAPIPATRPTNPQAAVRYDSIKYLWRPSGEPVSTESIRDGMNRFNEVLQTIRDRWKSDLNNVSEAEQAKKEHEIPILKERVETQRHLLEVALNAAIEYGHADILDNFGQWAPAMAALGAFLLERTKAGDHDGSFPRAIFEFLVRCKSLDTALMEKATISRMLLRFSKRGDDNMKALCKRITSNASAASKKSKEAKSMISTPATSNAVKSKTDPARKPSTVPSTGVKRPASEGGNDQPAKKFAGSRGDGPAKTGQAAQKATPASPASKFGSAPAVKQRTNTVTAKPSSFIASLQAPKKPAVALQKPAVPKPALEKKAPVQTDSASGFSFASVLADVTKPKETKPVEPKRTEKILNETPEERTMRLRKERRRKLHVAFKPADALVEIRYFTHDPDEDLGHDSSQTRDVGDTRSEGKMLKMQSHLMDVDEEDDGDNSGGLFAGEWHEPSFVDFSFLPDETKSQNFIPYGGGQEAPETPEKTIQVDREASILGVFYTDPAEIPSNPKEPPADVMEDAPEVMEFGALPEDFKKRVEEVKNKRAPTPTVSQDVLSILNQLQNNPIINQQQHQQRPPVAPSMNANLSQILSGLGQPSQHQPQNQGKPFLQQQSAGAPQLDAILSAMGHGNQNNFLQGNNYQNGPQVHRPAMAGGNPDITSILNSLQQQQQHSGPNPNMPFMPPMGQTPPMNQSGMQPMMNSFSGQDQSDGAVAPYENEERRRWRSQQGGDDVNGYKQRGKVQLGKDGLPFRVKTCTYWQAGHCTKGDQCTFLHEER